VSLLSPRHQVRRAIEQFAGLKRRLMQSGMTTVVSMRHRLRPVLAHLDALSPLAILSRGYAIARKLPEHELVRDAAQLEPGDKLSLIFGKGGATAAVERIEDTNHHG